jgi:hypothetical protein
MKLPGAVMDAKDAEDKYYRDIENDPSNVFNILASISKHDRHGKWNDKKGTFESYNSLKNTTDKLGNTVFDYLQIISNCHRDCENAKVVLCTPPHATVNPKMSNCGYKPNVDNATAEVKQIAKDKNLALIDLNAFNGFNDDNENIMQPNDGLHFSELGYKTLADFIKNELKSLYPQLF